MTDPAKILFDENFGLPIVAALRTLVAFQRDTPVLKSIKELSYGGIPDDQWIPKLAEERWIVITSDRGKQCGGPKLPQVCSAFGVTHLLLSSAVHGLPQFEKMRAILSVWPRICDFSGESPGSRFYLRMSADRSRFNLDAAAAIASKKQAELKRESPPIT